MQNKRTYYRLIKNDKLFSINIGLMITGIILGTLLFTFMKSEFISKIISSQYNYLLIRRNNGFIAIFFKSFIISTLFIVIEFLLGFSAIAQPLEYIIVIIRGMGIGTILSQIYISLSVKSVFFSLIIIIPQLLISSYMLSVAAKESVKFSNKLFINLTTDNSYFCMSRYLKIYSLRFLVLEFFMIISATIDGICSILFISKI